MRVETLLLDGECPTIVASSEGTDAACPLCGQRADRVQSWYTRTLADLPWATLAARLRIVVRKFFCDPPPVRARSLPSGLRGSPSRTPAAPTASRKP